MKKNIKKVILFVLIYLIFPCILFYQPYAIKHLIISKYKQGLESALNKLDKEKKKDAEEALRYLEKGEFIPDEAHDTEDFAHLDYFGEPWRDWKSTYRVWNLARNYYLVFLLLLSIKIFWDYTKKKKYA